jgi:photosystem I reaction center subunit XII
MGISESQVLTALVVALFPLGLAVLLSTTLYNT